MKPERKLQCVVSGSFKFKPEIDRAIDEFSELGVKVLAPDKGWLQKPSRLLHSLAEKGFRPLPSERKMTSVQVEDAFLRALSQSDFVYVVNPEGYVGSMVSLEIGFAMGLGIPIYSQEQISPTLDLDMSWRDRAIQIQSLSIFEVIKDVLDKAR